jgi:hypothetical protein
MLFKVYQALRGIFLRQYYKWRYSQNPAKKGVAEDETIVVTSAGATPAKNNVKFEKAEEIMKFEDHGGLEASLGKTKKEFKNL